jgi:hypothetical protein
MNQALSASMVTSSIACTGEIISDWSLIMPRVVRTPSRIGLLPNDPPNNNHSLKPHDSTSRGKNPMFKDMPPLQRPTSIASAMKQGDAMSLSKQLKQFGKNPSQTAAEFLRGHDVEPALFSAMTEDESDGQDESPDLSNRMAELFDGRKEAMKLWGSAVLNRAKNGDLTSKELLTLLEAEHAGKSALRKNLEYQRDGLFRWFDIDVSFRHAILDVEYLKIAKQAVPYLTPEDCRHLLDTLRKAQATSSPIGKVAKGLGLTANRSAYANAKKSTVAFKREMKFVKTALKQKIEQSKQASSSVNPS